jgi:hypothetical protein
MQKLLLLRKTSIVITYHIATISSACSSRGSRNGGDSKKSFALLENANKRIMMMENGMASVVIQNPKRTTQNMTEEKWKKPMGAQVLHYLQHVASGELDFLR